MKKKFLFGLIFMSVAVLTGTKAYNYCMTQSGMSVLLMSNVEALTRSEDDYNPWLRTCYAYGYLGSGDEYVCEGQRPEDEPQTCVTVAFYNGHENYKRKCVLRGF